MIALLYIRFYINFAVSNACAWGALEKSIAHYTFFVLKFGLPLIRFAPKKVVGSADGCLRHWGDLPRPPPTDEQEKASNVKKLTVIKRKNIMGFCSYHIKKGKGGAGGLGIHIDRIKVEREDNYNSFPNADPARTHLNISYPCNGYEAMPLQSAISKRLKEGYKDMNNSGELRKIRKDACIFSEHVFTGTHEDLKAIEADPQRLQEWVQANRKFAEEMYRAENIVRFTLHLDETTPHIHCVIVNLTEDGRLAAKEILGGRKDLKEKQDKYAEYMKPFGLKRGLEDTGITHEGAEEYYKRVNAAKKLEGELTVYKNIFGIKNIDIDKTLENYNSKIAGLQEEAALYKRKYEGLMKSKTNIKKKEENLKEREEKVKEGEQWVADKNAQVRRISKILTDRKARIEELEKEVEELKKAKEKAQEEQQKANEELAKLQHLKEYEGLTNSKVYIEDSLHFRENYDINAAREVMNEFTKYKWENLDVLDEFFEREMRKKGVIYPDTDLIKAEYERLIHELVEQGKLDIQRMSRRQQL